jgi:signal transduction histidine kinase
MASTHTGRPDGGSLLGDFIRRRSAAILARWEAAAREVGAARAMTRPALLDHVPQILADMARMADELAAGRRPRPTFENIEIHALARLEEGFDVAQVVAEFSSLRDAITELFSDEMRDDEALHETRLLDQSIDGAISLSVVRYAEARDRTLRALDRISTAALDADGVDEFLQRLVVVMAETTPAVDDVAVMLQADGEDDPRVAARTRVGDGPARAVYDVQLEDNDGRYGFVRMASSTATEFSEQDKHLLHALARRAVAGLVQHRLRAQAEAAVARERAARAQLEAVLEAIPDALYIGDATGVKHANKTGLRMLGLTDVAQLNDDIGVVGARIEARDAATGRPLAPEDHVFAQALGGRAAAADVLVKNAATGADVVVRSSAAPIVIDGRIVGAVAINSDVTERVALHAAVEREARFRERFIAVLGHDLRNPVHAVRMAAELLARRGDQSEAALKLVRRVEASAQRMQLMLDDLVDFTRTRMAGQEMVVQRVDTTMDAIVRPVLDELLLAHPERRAAYTEAGDLAGAWDPGRVAQLASNLIANAIKYGRPDAPIAVSVRGVDGAVVLSVHNEGPPIPADMLPRLFDPYRRGETTSHADKGLGLGLFVVDQVARAHGGAVVVASTAEAGTTFTVTLPRADQGASTRDSTA